MGQFINVFNNFENQPKQFITTQFKISEVEITIVGGVDIYY